MGSESLGDGCCRVVLDIQHINHQRSSEKPGHHWPHLTQYQCAYFASLAVYDPGTGVTIDAEPAVVPLDIIDTMRASKRPAFQLSVIAKPSTFASRI